MNNSSVQWGATEVCPYCGIENFYSLYDANEKGYIVKCKGCHEKISLCDSCLHNDDNKYGKCDWHNGKCFRGNTKENCNGISSI